MALAPGWPAEPGTWLSAIQKLLAGRAGGRPPAWDPLEAFQTPSLCSTCDPIPAQVLTSLAHLPGGLHLPFPLLRFFPTPTYETNIFLPRAFPRVLKLPRIIITFLGFNKWPGVKPQSHISENPGF